MFQTCDHCFERGQELVDTLCKQLVAGHHHPSGVLKLCKALLTTWLQVEVGREAFGMNCTDFLVDDTM